RFSPLCNGGAYRKPRSLFRRLFGFTAGTAFFLEVWLPLSRAVVFLAEAKARHVHVRQQSSRNGDVSAKSRPDREFRSRLANSSTLLLWAVQSDDCSVLARPRNADAVPRPGICVLLAVCLFCRLQWRSGGKG